MASSSGSGTSGSEPTTIVGDPRDAVPLVFTPPAKVDRYIIGREVGAGGLGIVFEAWDPKLERPVAVKLVRPHSGNPRGAARFLREAQALARLNHPNVVSVYSHGTCDDAETVYVVMQFIDGQTVGAWSEEPRSFEEIRDVYVAAGKGLAAAHAQGVVHRDFKPGNVMIDAEGNVQVLDFGLALVAGAGTRSAVDSRAVVAPSVDSDESADERLTQDGIVMGTPRYMAPEQHLGRHVDAASDQFSFCLALLRTLRRGRDVYEAKGHRELAAAKLRCRVTPRAPSDLAPEWMEEVLLRGLSGKPEERWPSMTALLDAMRHAPRRLWPVAVGVGLLCAGAVGLALPSEDTDCTRGASRLVSAWDDADDAEIESAFSDSLGSARGPEMFERLRSAFDEDAKAWADVYTRTCTEHAAGRLESVAFDGRMACLRSRARQREALLHRVEEGEAAVLRDLTVRLLQLGEIDDCTQDSTLAARTPLPQDSAARAAVIDVRAKLVTVPIMARDGDFEGALVVLDAQGAAAKDIGFEPLFAEVQKASGELRAERGEYESAAVAFEDGLSAAVSSGHDLFAVECAAALVYLYAIRLNRTEDAEQMLSRAKALVERAGDPPNLRQRVGSVEALLFNRLQSYDEAKRVLEELIPTLPTETQWQRYQLTTLLNNLGLQYQQLGEYDKAVETLEEALSIRSELFGENHPKIGALHLNIGNTLLRGTKLTDAEPHFDRAIELMTQGYGKAHVELSRPYISRGVVRKKQGRFEEARADYEHALTLLEGKKSPTQEALVLANLGNLDKRTGRLESALQRHQEALAIREEQLGPKSLDVAESLSDIGSLHRGAERYDQARANYARAASIKLEVHGPDHPEMVAVHLSAANLALDEDKLGEAKTALDEGMRIIERTGSSSTTAGLTWQALGRLRAAEGSQEEAAAAYERALSVLTEVRASPQHRGAARFELAKALWAIDQVGRARDAISAARVELREGGPGTADALAELEEVVASWGDGG